VALDAQNLPAGHARHALELVEPVAELYLPDPHCVGLTELAGQYDPAVQVFPVAVPAAGQYLPAGHGIGAEFLGQ